MTKPLTYSSYLKLDALLSLQETQAKPAHLDEMQFIIVHQAFELWFKLVLHEIDEIFLALNKRDVRSATKLVRRITQIERLWLEQIHILETMSPTDFLRFRDLLGPSSGLQSWQFREIEFASGLKDPRFLALHEGQPEVQARLKARMAAPSLWDAFVATLSKAGLDTGAGRMASLKALYQDPAHEGLHAMAEALIEYDEYLSLWRAHHIHMVSRMIGGKPGTGSKIVEKSLQNDKAMGAQGVDYLQSTLGRKCFPELWEVRTLLERP